MTATRKLSKVAEAYERCHEGRDQLIESGYRCMEVTEDKCGILWERWITPNGISVILFATPHSWDIFSPLSHSPRNDITFNEIKRLATVTHSEFFPPSKAE